MRKLLLVLLLALPLAQAKERDHVVIPTDIHCFKINMLIDELKLKYGEEPIFMGKSELDKESVTMIFANQQTGSYTIVGLGKYIGCVFDTGNDIHYRMPKVLENKSM
jgi:hypothetical protein